jgi:subtilase family serine protease
VSRKLLYVCVLSILFVVLQTVCISDSSSIDKWIEDFETGLDGWDHRDGNISFFDVQNSIVYEGNYAAKMTGHWDGDGGYAGCYKYNVSLLVNPDSTFEFAYYFPSKNISYVGYRLRFDTNKVGSYFSLFSGYFVNTSNSYLHQYKNEDINNWYFHRENIYSNYENAFGDVPSDLHITSIQILMGDPYHTNKIQTCYYDGIIISNTSSETILFSDDFENIVNGDYPNENGWKNMFSGVTAYVSTNKAYDGSKSFRLEAYPNWARADYIKLASIPDQLSYEAAVYVDDISRGVVIGFSISKGSYVYDFNYMTFDKSGYIKFVGLDNEIYQIQQYQSKTWYKIRVDLDYKACTVDVYLNDLLKVTDYNIWPKDFYYSQCGDVYLDNFAIRMRNFEGSGTGIAFFDDIKLYEIEKTQPESTVSGIVKDDLSKGISGVNLKLQSLFSTYNTSKISDGNGNYTFVNLQSGEYQLISSKVNHENKILEKNISQLNIISGENSTKDIRLGKESNHLDFKNVKLNSFSSSCMVNPSETVTFEFDYTMWTDFTLKNENYFLIIGIDDTPVDAMDIGSPGSYPGKTSIDLVNLTAPSSAGTYSVYGTFVNTNDQNNAMDEYINNLEFKTKLGEIIVGGPDLIIEDLSWTPYNIGIGEIIKFSVTVKNNGTQVANQSTLRYQIREDSDDIMIGNILSGESSTVFFNHTANITGNMTLVIDIDPDNEIIESNENNNFKEVKIVVSGPDLIIQMVNYPLSEVFPVSQIIDFKIVIKNQGIVSSGGFYLGFDEEKIMVDSLLGNEIIIKNISWIPKEPKIYYISIIADVDNNVFEINKDNNEYLININSKGADLLIQDVNILTTTAKFGEKIYYSIKIKNQGFVDTGEFYLRTEIGQHEEFHKILNIRAQETKTLNLSWTVNSTKVNTFDLSVDVDAYNNIIEGDEENNKGFESEGIDILLPDVITKLYYEPDSVEEGDIVHFQVIVKNQGMGDVITPFIIKICRENNPDPIESWEINYLASNESLNFLCNWTADIVGLNIIETIVDEDNNIFYEESHDNSGDEVEIDVKESKGKSILFQIILFVIIPFILTAIVALITIYKSGLIVEKAFLIYLKITVIILIISILILIFLIVL